MTTPSDERGKLPAVAFQYSALERVYCGVDAVSTLAAELDTLGARRVFLLASNSLNSVSDDFASMRAALGDRFVGHFHAIGAHTPRGDVMRALAEVRQAQADLLVTVGGGSIIDAGKTVQLALDQGVETEQQLLQYAQLADGSRGPKCGDFSLFAKGSCIRQIAIPTTLSGAEFSNNAGVMNTEISAKEGYRGIDLCPQVVIYDPALSLHTPQWLWLSTAIRSLDHAVEGYCSIDAHPYLEAHFLHAMSLFAESLPRLLVDPEDLSSRSLNQQAVWLACCGLGKVSHGASHGIGYILGSLCSVPHGHTSCVMLPAVLAWNEAHNGRRQQAIARALAKGEGQDSAAQAVKKLVASLGLPTSLQQVGVDKSQFAEIAQRACQHPVVQKNPRPIAAPEQVLEILELAWA